MSQELIYTSAPKGLKLGSRGFCTVASTSGMAKNLAERMEALSGYKHLFASGDPQPGLNPVNISYSRFALGGRTYYLLSRIADAGLDYTQRTNKLAHHVALDRAELGTAGPAWLASQPGFFVTAWSGDPRMLAAERRIPQGQLRTRVCRTWANVAGDAGWAGVLAESLFIQALPEAYLICAPDIDRLALILEAQSLLPPDQRWDATFSTYFTKVPPGVDCRWRCIIDGTPEAIRARQSPEKLVIDLMKPLGVAVGSELVLAARTGEHATKSDANIATTETIAAVVGFSDQNAASPVPARTRTLTHARVVGTTTEHPPALPGISDVASRALQRPTKPSIWKATAYACSLLIAMAIGAFALWGFGRIDTPAPIAEVQDNCIDDSPENQKASPSSSSRQDKTHRENQEDRSRPSSSAADIPITANKAGENTTNQQPDSIQQESPETRKESSPSVDVEKACAMAATVPQSTNLFSKIHSEAQLLKVLRTQVVPASKWTEQVPLGTFSTAPTSVDVALLGTRNNTQLVVVKQTDKNGLKWEIRSDSTVVAILSINATNMSFRWTEDIREQRAMIEEAINDIVLELHVPPAESAPYLKYVSFRPAQKTQPLAFHESLYNTGLQRQFLGDDKLRVPDGQRSILHFQLTDPSCFDKDSNCRLQGSVAEGQSTTIRLGPKETIRLSIEYRLEEETRRPLIIAQLLLADTDTSFPLWLKKLEKERERIRTHFQNDFKKSIEQWVTDYKSLPPCVTALLPETASQNSTQQKLDNMIEQLDNMIEQIANMDEKRLREWVDGNIRTIGKISDTLGKPGLRQKVEILKKHQQDYAYLEEWTKLLGSLREHQELHLRIARIPVAPDGDERQRPEIDLYIAGSP